jgi:hypothetical protein
MKNPLRGEGDPEGTEVLVEYPSGLLERFQTPEAPCGQSVVERPLADGSDAVDERRTGVRRPRRRVPSVGTS